MLTDDHSQSLHKHSTAAKTTSRSTMTVVGRTRMKQLPAHMENVWSPTQEIFGSFTPSSDFKKPLDFCIIWYCDLYCREITYVFVGSQNSWSEPSSVGNVLKQIQGITEDSRLFLFIRPYLEATLGSFCLIQVLRTDSSLHSQYYQDNLILSEPFNIYRIFQYFQELLILSRAFNTFKNY